MEELSSYDTLFLQAMKSVPRPYFTEDALRRSTEWREIAARQPADLSTWMLSIAQETHPIRNLLLAVFGNSPYLSHLLIQYPALLHKIALEGPDETHNTLKSELLALNIADSQHEIMQSLRTAKKQLALLAALADIAGLWSLEQVTEALSALAEGSLTLALNALLYAAGKRGEIVLEDIGDPSKNCGIIILGMGKLGGRELNYSSDIDLIVFFERGKLAYQGRHNEQHFMNRLAYDLVAMMQERTAHGYVFRTDLRLRPDPASTPPAVNTDAAYFYYESVGQNWERAAMIKARPVAGDLEAGEKFLQGIKPFLWRRSLDFASINDIHSIKRQMDSGQNGPINAKNYNIKLGRGGIREIEFYTQIHQLIWGGRQPALRSRGTCETLMRLVEAGLVEEAKDNLLRDAYAFYRKLEHRLQMVADEQTHSLPDTEEGIAHIACFMGYNDPDAFIADLLPYLRSVHDIYASSFKSAEKLGDEGNLVFTGTSHDPETLATLRRMGFNHPETISEIIMGWHHGSRRATRTKRARELLTELMPLLLKRFSETANPDSAFLKFNEFLANMPAGVQLFSLFSVNPHLLGLIADIMGSAPTLADTLSKSAELLESVLYADFYGPLSSEWHLKEQLEDALLHAQDFEERMDGLRHFRNEKQFQAGVQMLKHMISAQHAGQFLSSLADVTITKTLQIVTEEFEKTYGLIPGSRFAIIALGKLGSREMTFSSDIDLVFVYDVEDFEIVSTGEKGFTASVYYNRLAQRFLNALSAMGREGRLYEVDTRLRPSGKQGLLAVSTKALEHYFDELAWTFEFMAFTKARIVSADAQLHEQLEQFIARQLARPHKEGDEKLRSDVVDMRERIFKEHRAHSPWDIKYARGGLMDIDFIAQYLLLRYAPSTPGVKAGSAADIIEWLISCKRLSHGMGHQLLEADRFLGQVFNMLRLCSSREFDEETAPQGLKKILYETVNEKDFSSLKERLLQVEQTVVAAYIELLTPEHPKEH